MQLGSTRVEDTFAEAFGMAYTRLILTACDDYWLDAAGRELTGYSASVIGCDAEAGIERRLDADSTPDGRNGAAVLLFGFSSKALAKAVPNRVGQCVMTCPTSAVYDGLPQAAERLPLGKHLRYFGDGYQKSKRLDGTRYWRIPVMDGEFIVQELVGVGQGVGGGNVIIQAVDQQTGLQAARRAVQAVAQQTGVVTPFPAGVARSGSKVGSRYPGLVASTAEAFCPTLRGRVDSRLDPAAQSAYEVVIDGVGQREVAAAMAAAMHAAAGEGVVCLSAGNYGGQLGKYHFSLHQLLAD